MDTTRGTGLLPGSAAEHELQLQYGTGDRARRFYENSVLDHLNERMAAYVARQEMVFVSTADASGDCDSSFRAGPAGFVRVLDRGTLAYPEYRGNGVMATLGNLTENPHIGLLLIDFGQDGVGLHVNGRARVVELDEARLLGLDGVDPGAPPGRRPERWVLVEVEEAYIHCSKHIPRLVKVDRTVHWGTDDVKRKGGDFFGTAAGRGEDRTAARDRLPDPGVGVGVGVGVCVGVATGEAVASSLAASIDGADATPVTPTIPATAAGTAKAASLAPPPSHRPTGFTALLKRRRGR